MPWRWDLWTKSFSNVFYILMPHLSSWFGFLSPKVPLSKDSNLVKQCQVFIARVFKFLNVEFTKFVSCMWLVISTPFYQWNTKLTTIQRSMDLDRNLDFSKISIFLIEIMPHYINLQTSSKEFLDNVKFMVFLTYMFNTLRGGGCKSCVTEGIIVWCTLMARTKEMDHAITYSFKGPCNCLQNVKGGILPTP